MAPQEPLLPRPQISRHAIKRHFQIKQRRHNRYIRRRPNIFTVSQEVVIQLMIAATLAFPRLELEKVKRWDGTTEYKPPRLTFYLKTDQTLGVDAETGEDCHILVVTISMEDYEVITVYPSPNILPWHANIDVHDQWEQRLRAMRRYSPWEANYVTRSYNWLKRFYGSQ